MTTAIGLAVAILAVVFYNAIDKRVSDFGVALEASAAEWAALLAEPPAGGGSVEAPAFPSASSHRSRRPTRRGHDAAAHLHRLRVEPAARAQDGEREQYRGDADHESASGERLRSGRDGRTG